MIKKKRLAPTLIFLLVLVFGVPCVAGAESKEALSSSAPVFSGPQYFTSTSVVSDSLASDSSQGSIEWKMGWNLVDGSWYFSDAINPVSLHSGWLYAGGTWYWLEPDAGGAMVTGLHECYGSMYWFGPSGAMATGWVLDGGTWYYATGSGALARGPVSFGGVPYCFDAETGAMLTGYQTDACF